MNHSVKCRERLQEAMAQTPEGARRFAEAKARFDRAAHDLSRPDDVDPASQGEKAEVVRAQGPGAEDAT